MSLDRSPVVSDRSGWLPRRIGCQRHDSGSLCVDLPRHRWNEGHTVELRRDARGGFGVGHIHDDPLVAERDPYHAGNGKQRRAMMGELVGVRFTGRLVRDLR